MTKNHTLANLLYTNPSQTVSKLLLNLGFCMVTYRKIDGKLTNFNCTTNESMASKHTSLPMSAGLGDMGGGLTLVYDLIREDFRQIYMGEITSIHLVAKDTSAKYTKVAETSETEDKVEETQEYKPLSDNEVTAYQCGYNSGIAAFIEILKSTQDVNFAIDLVSRTKFEF